ncbi:MAG: hypothetical protein Q9208_000753 [Pyrenodesmia sp. 3 TL-2023]
MAQGERNLQIEYNAVWTAGSFFLPICVVSIAFYLLGLSETVKVTRIVVVGLLTGTAVCGMHYSGQGGISNYTVSYRWEYVLGAAIIAVMAATVALGVFFYLKATWTNTWAKKALCASVLAASVSGMHWVATAGTVYRYKERRGKGGGFSRQATVVIVLCLAIGCCIALLTFAIIGQRVKNRAAHRAQQVVLASIIFDNEGKLMVTPEGRVPCRKIAKSSMERNFDEIFDTDHPVFAWVYRASYSWPSVIDLIPGFKAHLGVMKARKSSQVGLRDIFSDPAMDNDLVEEANFGTKFKELFCVAASELADSIHEPLKDLGGLYESIMLTGTIDKSTKLRLFSRTIAANPLSKAEYGQMHPTFGRGQLLFLIRRASKRDAAKLQAAGFNFANLTHIMPAIAQSMEVTIGELSSKLLGIQRCLSDQSMLEPGVHMACYALRPRLHGGWGVLINKDKRNLLPSVQLTPGDIKSWQLAILMELHDMTVRDCYLYLQHRSSDAQDEQKGFLSLVEHAIESLAGQIEHPLFDNARFLAHPYLVPCRTSPGSQHRGKAMVMMFRVIADAHYSCPLKGRFEFGSSRLFRAQQHVYPQSPDHAAFARQVHLEFACVAEARAGVKAISPSTSGRSSPRKTSKSSEASSPFETSVEGDDNNSTSTISRSPTFYGQSGTGKKKRPPAKSARSFFGGIHVQNEISVNVSEMEQGQETEQGFEMNSLGVQSEVTVAPTEIDTFADELMLLLIEERRQQSVRVAKSRSYKDPPTTTSHSSRTKLENSYASDNRYISNDSARPWLSTSVNRLGATTDPMHVLVPVTTLKPPCDARAWLASPHPDLPIVAIATHNLVRVYSLTSFTLISRITGGHKRSVRSCAWQPGSKEQPVIATGGFDASVGIWSQEQDDKEEWRFAIVLEGHDSEVKSVAWSAGGNLLATCSRDKSVWIWEEVGEDDYETVAVLKEHEGDVKCVAWHPEEELLASASYDDDVRLWREEIDDWGCVSILRGHTSTVWAVEWEPVKGMREDQSGGPRLASCSDDTTIRIWKKQRSQEPRQPQSRLSTIRSADGEEWEEEDQLPRWHSRAIYSVAWSKASHRIASVGADGKIIVYEECAEHIGDKRVWDLSSPTDHMADLALSNQVQKDINLDGAEVDTSNSTTAPERVSPSTWHWQVVAEYECAHGVSEINHVAWSMAKVNGAWQEVIITSGDDGEVRIWKVSSPEK